MFGRNSVKAEIKAMRKQVKVHADNIVALMKDGNQFAAMAELRLKTDLEANLNRLVANGRSDFELVRPAR